MMIEISPVEWLRTGGKEEMVAGGWPCPKCSGNGWLWGQDDEHMCGWVKNECGTCGGSGRVEAVVTVKWRKEGVYE